jgi:hypothetical protein
MKREAPCQQLLLSFFVDGLGFAPLAILFKLDFALDKLLVFA